MNYIDKYIKLKEMYGANQITGLIDTNLDNVHMFWISESVKRSPLICNPGIVIIGQGIKTGYLDGRTFQYDADNYLISSVPTAYECETRSTKENPLLGLFIDLDISRLRHLIEKIENHKGPFKFKNTDVFQGVEPIKMGVSMHEVTEKLLSCLRSPLDSDVLGQSLIDEIYYRVLLGSHGQALVALTHQETRYARIAQSLSYIHEHYMEKINIDDLALHANMSLSAFHRAFKAVTGESPIQYLKKARLNKARFMIVQEGMRVNTAAEQVGYESVSQFSREFKRFFNISPSMAKNVIYI